MTYRLALTRSHHTLSIVEGKAYIFGGEFGEGKLCSNDVYVITLPATGKEEEAHETASSCILAMPSPEEENTPSPRTKHAVSVQGHELALFGGCNENNHPIDQDSCIWIFNTTTSQWRKISTASHASSNAGTPPPRYNHKLFAYNGHLILHGGQTSEEGGLLNDTWFLDLTSNIWTRLPDSPVHSDSIALVDGKLYSIAQLETESFAHIYTLEIGDKVPAADPATLLTDLKWEAVSSEVKEGEGDMPPQSRVGGGLVPITTGYGRQYLTYFFGSSSHPFSPSSPSSNQNEPRPATYNSDIWTYQIASKPTFPNTASWTSPFKPAAIKDSIRNAIGKPSGEGEWAEVEVLAKEEMGREGKVHPGPRAWFGVDVGSDGRSVVVWGGVNAKGEREGDGWMVGFE